MSQSGQPIGALDVLSFVAVVGAIAIPADGPVLDAAAIAAAGARAARVAAALGISASLAGDQSRNSDPIFRHYTTADGLAGITESGVIRPSANGLVYVTPTIYPSAAVAKEALELGRTPAGYFEIPQSRLPGLTPQPPTSGGGVQFTAPGPVPAAGLLWVPIGP